MGYPDNPSSWPDPSSTPPQQPVPPPPAVAPGYPGTGPPGYGYGGYPPAGYPPAPPKTNNLGVAAMVVSIASAVSLLCAFCIGPLAVVSLGGGVTGTVLGFVARRQIRERGEHGEGMALTGIIVGLVAAVLGVLAVIVAVIWIGWRAQYASSFE
jgi:hypothetical protein